MPFESKDDTKRQPYNLMLSSLEQKNNFYFNLFFSFLLNNNPKRLSQGPEVEYPIEPTSLPAMSTSATMEDSQSTDSSSFDDELKKRRRKLHFPFGKKSSKNKTQ